MTSIRQIAEIAGVSTSTVSLALRDDPRVRAETRARIRDLAAQYHYHGVQARCLASSTATIGCLVPFVSVPIYAQILSGILHAAFDHAHHTLVLEHEHQLVDDTFYALQALIAQRVQGLIIVGAAHPIPRNAILEMRSHNIVPMLVACNGAELPVDQVCINEAQLAASAVDYLVQLGHQALAYIEPESMTAHAPRKEAIQRAAAHRKLHMTNLKVATTDAPAAVFATLAHLRPPPTALMVENDALAMRLLHGAPLLGLRIPDDYSIIGCGDYFGSGVMTPELTTVNLYPEVLGRHATAHLIARIHQSSPSSDPVVEMVPIRFIVRHSCAGPGQSRTAPPPSRPRTLPPHQSAVATFLNLLRAGFSDFSIYITARDGGMPASPELWGWTQLREYAHTWKPKPNSLHLGYLDDNGWLMLYPHRVQAFLATMTASTGQAFPYSFIMLKRMLAEAGILACTQERHITRYTHVVRVACKTHRLLRLQGQALTME